MKGPIIIAICLLFTFLIGISANALFAPTPPPYNGGSAGGNVSNILSTSPYLVISSIGGIFSIFFNETRLNQTIDNKLLGFSGGNTSFNQSLTDSLYVPYTGANSNVDLGNKNLSAEYITAAENISASWFNGYLRYQYVYNPPWLTSFTETDPYWTADKPNYYNKTQVDALIASVNTTMIPGNNTIIELETCDGTCTTIVEIEYAS